jgi:glycosyltransferase involved in cell wall biosynthesis
MEPYNLCIIKPNADAFSETFIKEHIKRLQGNKKVLYGGAFPVYDEDGKYLIKSKLGLLSYLFQKRVLKRNNIKVRNRALVRYFKNNKIDIVFAEYGMVGAMVTKACAAAGIPLVIHFHGADVYHRPTVEKYRDYYQKAFKYASAFIVVSADMINDLNKLGAPLNKIYNVPCGVDTSFFSPVKIDLRSRTFLSVGRFVEKKSPSSVVKAFEVVSKQYADARLIMIGKGPLYDDTQRLVDELNLQEKVIFKGVQQSAQIQELMKQAICFVQHSVTASNGDKEGTPVTIMEASSSALPVISTRHSGIKEAVIDGESGFLVEEHDIVNMGAKMISLLGQPDLAPRMGAVGREHMIAAYNVVKQVEKLDKIISNSLKEYHHTSAYKNAANRT